MTFPRRHFRAATSTQDIFAREDVVRENVGAEMSVNHGALFNVISTGVY
jgi:hypothetical protein